MLGMFHQTKKVFTRDIKEQIHDHNHMHVHLLTIVEESQSLILKTK